MKDFINKILSIALALIVLFATTSFTLDSHFCCDKLVSSSFFGQAESCKDLKADLSKDDTTCTKKNKNCCDSKTFTKSASDALQKYSFESKIEFFVFLNSFHYPSINLFSGFKEHSFSFLIYTPPLVPKDFQLLHEVFLI